MPCAAIGDGRDIIAQLQWRECIVQLADGRHGRVQRIPVLIVIHPLVFARGQRTGALVDFYPGFPPEAKKPRETGNGVDAGHDPHLVEIHVAGGGQGPFQGDVPLVAFQIGQVRAGLRFEPVVEPAVRVIGQNARVRRDNAALQRRRRHQRLVGGTRRIGALCRAVPGPLAGIGQHRGNVPIGSLQETHWDRNPASWPSRALPRSAHPTPPPRRRPRRRNSCGPPWCGCAQCCAAASRARFAAATGRCSDKCPRPAAPSGPGRSRWGGHPGPPRGWSAR